MLKRELSSSSRRREASHTILPERHRLLEDAEAGGAQRRLHQAQSDFERPDTAATRGASEVPHLCGSLNKVLAIGFCFRPGEAAIMFGRKRTADGYERSEQWLSV
jgi:hypothetical protein